MAAVMAGQAKAPHPLLQCVCTVQFNPCLFVSVKIKGEEEKIKDNSLSLFLFLAPFFVFFLEKRPGRGERESCSRLEP
jgi:hypothetical protein